MSNTLQVTSLSKYYGKKQVLKNLSFSMESGEIVGLLGPNGAGKTTAFYIIVGFIKSNGGKVVLNGENISNYPMYKRARLGLSYLPQESSIFRKLSVENNIKLVIQEQTSMNKKEQKDLLEKLLADFGLTKLRKQAAFTLSGGEKRRCEIARALASKPKFLLLDEPFAGIDPIAIFDIQQIIKKLSEEGIGILITDHNVRDTLAITTSSYIIHAGEIQVSGTRDEVLNDENARKIYFGDNFDRV